MKKLLAILLLSLPLLSMAQWAKPTSGEYQVGFLFSGGTMKTAGGGSTGQGASNLVSNKGYLQNIHFNDGKTRTVLYGFSGLHTFFVVTAGPTGTTTGDTLWGTGLNDGHWQGSSTAPAQNSFIPILVDNNGNPLTNIAGGWASATAGTIDVTAFAYVWKTDGTLWLIGNCTGGLAGDGTTGNSAGVDSFFTQVPPTPFGSHKIVKVRGMFFPIALDDAGNVYTWGNNNYIGYQLGRSGDYKTPIAVSLGVGRTGLDITSNSLASFVITDDHHLRGWSFYSALMGIGVHWSGTYSVTTPTDITTSQGLTGLTYSSITNIEETFYATMSDGTMRAWGDGPEGTGGVVGDAGARTIDFTTTSPVQYNYNGGQGENIIPLPLNPFSCPYTILSMPEGGYFQRDGWVVATDGVNYYYFHIGRNKNGVGLYIVNGDAAFQQEAVYADWSVDSVMTLRDITSTSQALAEAHYCTLNPGATACHANYTPPSEANPTVSAGSNQTIGITTATLSGSATGASGHSITRYQWTAACGIYFTSSPFAASPTVSGLSAGANVLTLTATDDANKSNTSTVTITVTAQTGYFFNTSTGSDANPCTLSQPCLTLTKANSVALGLGAGDSLEFAAGQIFPGTLRITISGVQGAPFVITTYGSGASAILGGMTQLTMTGAGPNYTATCSGCTASTQIVTFDGQLTSKGRTPNQTTGYYIPTSMAIGSITDAAHAASVTTGSLVVGRSSGYTIDNVTVTGVSSGVISVSPNFYSATAGGNGWFFWSTPDSATEWSYSGGTGGTVTVNGASGHTIKVATADTVCSITGSYVKVYKMGLHGANTAIVYSAGMYDSLVRDTLKNGFDGILYASAQLTVDSTQILNCLDNGMFPTSGAPDHMRCTHLFLDSIGLWPGMGRSGPVASYEGINGPGAFSVFRYNTYANIGFNCLYTGAGDSTYADSSIGHDYCLIKIDGSMDYWWINSLPTWTFGRFDRGNYAYNGGGPMSYNGTTLGNSSAVFGTYLDSKTSGVTVSGLTTDNLLSGGIQNHGPNNTITGCTLNGNPYGGIVNYQCNGCTTISGVAITGNIINVTSGGMAVRQITFGTNQATMAFYDNNVYLHSSSTTPLYTFASGDPGTPRTLAAWQPIVAGDAHSSFTNLACSFVGNPSFATKTIKLPGIYIDPPGTYMPPNQGRYINSVTESQLSGKVLQLQTPGQRWPFKKRF